MVTAGVSVAFKSMEQVVDIDAALEKVMRMWFEQRHEWRRQLVKTIETFRGGETADRLDYARCVQTEVESSGRVEQAKRVEAGPKRSAILNWFQTLTFCQERSITA